MRLKIWIQVEGNNTTGGKWESLISRRFGAEGSNAIGQVLMSAEDTITARTNRQIGNKWAVRGVYFP